MFSYNNANLRSFEEEVVCSLKELRKGDTIMKGSQWGSN